MRDAVLTVLAPDAPLGALARSYAMPCCVLVALALRVAVTPSLADLMGRDMSPSKRYKRLVDGVAATDRRWWGEMMIGDPKRPWSVLDAAARVPGGRIVAPREVGHLPAPELEAGRVSVVQRWRGLGSTRAAGHTYLVLAGDGPGDAVTVIQSAEDLPGRKLGYRVSSGSWDGTAGLTGWSVGAVVLANGRGP